MLSSKILLQFLNTKINIVYSATAFCVVVTLTEQLACASKYAKCLKSSHILSGNKKCSKN